MSLPELSPLEKAKLAVICVDDFTDQEAYDLVMKLSVHSEEEIHQIMNCIARNRPDILEMMKQYSNLPVS